MIKTKVLLISLLLAGALFSSGVSAVRAADEPVVVIARFFVKPRKETVFEERTHKVVELVRKADPENVNRLQRSTRNPLEYVFYEVFPSQDAFDHHIFETLPAVAMEVGPEPEGMLARPPEVEKLVPVGR
jgi:quinol monooxygenase YgiN